MQLFTLAIIATTLLILTSLGFAYFVKRLKSIRQPLQVWDTIQGFDFLPIRLRAWLFTWIIGLASPFTGGINFRFTEVEKGRACGVMKETKKVSTPFACVHPGALATFAETVGNIAFYSLLGKKDRAILVRLDADYVKVARGLLTASAAISPSIRDQKTDLIVHEVVIRDSACNIVAKISLTWKAEFKDE